MKRHIALFRLILAMLGICLYLTACDKNHDWEIHSGVLQDVGDSGGILSGIVQDIDSSLPISGASIEVYDGATLVGEATTDDDGAYSVSLEAGDEYSVDASAVGYVGDTQDNIIIVEDETTTLDFDLSATVSGTGTIQGVIRDIVSNNGINNVTIEIYDGVTLLATTYSDVNGNYSVEVTAGEDYEISISATGFIPANYFGVDLGVDETVTLESILQIADTYSGNGIIEGTITDSITGAGVASVTITLRDGLGAYSGDVVTTGTTAGDGTYSISDVPTGYYTAELAAAGYVTAYMSVYSLGGETTGNQNTSISPVVAAGETRIVLTWGASPTDLDSYLTGPTTSGSFSLNYTNQSVNDGTVANLDNDDTSSYGPETITITTQISGVYRYYVHDFSNAATNPSTALSNSSAQVKVYQSSGLVATYNIASNQGGTLWSVFELDGTTLTTVNTLSYDSTP